MKLARCAATVLALSATSLPVLARDGAPNIVGQPAPEIQTSEWFNSDGRMRMADFKGEVVLVEEFATWCGPCRGQMGHLTELKKKYGKRGLNVLSITNESRETVLKFLAQLNAAEVQYTMGLGGGAGGFKTPTIPHAWLISAEGNVVWQGNPGGLTDKVIEPELKKVVKPTDETRQARAERGLAYAKQLASDGRFLIADTLLEKLAQEFKGTPAGDEAAAKKQEIESGEETKAEFAAQQQLAKIIGGPEMPADRMKSAERDTATKKLQAFVAENEKKAPRTTEQAKSWLKVVTEDWAPEK